MEPTNRRGLLDALQEYGDKVKLLTNHKIVKRTSDGLEAVKGESGEKVTINADAIVLALGSAPVNKLAESLKRENIEFYCIGDCKDPKNIRQAIYEGSLVGRQI